MDQPTSAPANGQFREITGPALIVVLGALTVLSLLGPVFIDHNGQLDPLIADMALGVVGLMATVTVVFTVRAMLLDRMAERSEMPDGEQSRLH